MKYRVPATDGSTLQCLKLRRDIPNGDTSRLIRFPNSYLNDADSIIENSDLFENSSFEAQLVADQTTASGIIYPVDLHPYYTAPCGYAVEWVNENVSVISTVGTTSIVEVIDDKDHLALIRTSPDLNNGDYPLWPWYDNLAPFDRPGYYIGDYPYLGARYLSITMATDYPIYDKARDAIGIKFITAQIKQAYTSGAGIGAQNWAMPLAPIDHFICEFDDIQYNVAVKSTFDNSTAYLEQVQSDIAWLPIPNKNPAGAVRVKYVMTNGSDSPWQNFLLQPLAILDSPDGVGEFSGSFVTARRSFGFTFPVTRVRWCLGVSPTVAYLADGNNPPITVDDVNSSPVGKQSFIDQGLYFESTDLNQIYCTDQVESGPFHGSSQSYNTNEYDDVLSPLFRTGPSAIAVAGDDTDHLKNYQSSGFWPWFVTERYSTPDTQTEIEKWMCPRCPPTKVLSGSCVFDFEEVYWEGSDPVLSDHAEGYYPKITEPICTINNVDFHNYSGWDGTATRDAKLIFLAFNRALKRWELHTGYQWEVINLMSLVWDENYHLATISYLIDGTICTVAWKVIYTDVEGSPIKDVTYELWFKKSIDGGTTWETAVKIDTVNGPQLCRVNQSPTTGKYGVLNYVSDNGGGSWE